MPALAEKQIAARTNARTVIDRIAGLVHPRDGHRKILAMIEGYIDETGIHEGAKVCVVCGFFGGKGQWRKFERDWRAALDKHNVPLEKFHALNLVGRDGKRHGFFHGWTDQQFNALMGDLAAAITSYKISPVTHAIVIADFDSFPLIHRRFFTGAEIRGGRIVNSGCPNKPYFAPFMNCIKRIASYAPVGGKAHFFFGLDRPFGKYAAALYKILKTGPTLTSVAFRERLGDIAFPLAKETPQLQAADLLAYLTTQHVEERLAAGNFNSPPYGWLKQCLVRTHVHADHSIIERASLAETIRLTHEYSGDWEGPEDEKDLPD
jgi:hypothetical protein